MGLWSFYFFAKLFLFIQGVVKFDILYNFGLAIFLILPVPEKIRFRRVIFALKIITGVLLAVSIFWHDTWLPSPLDAAKELKSQGIPSKEYIYSFLIRYYDQQTFINLGIIFSACWVANKFLKLTTFVMIMFVALIPITIHAQPNEEEISMNTEAFLDSETSRVVRFKAPKGGKLDFDLLYLHVCSLSWDDMKDAGIENDQFFVQFNFLFKNFNTATTYSGPALVRFLRSNCGQTSHSMIYKDQPAECYLFPALDWVGFSVFPVLNHDGNYGGFAKQIKQNGIPRAPMELDQSALYLNMFDNSPVYDDYMTLSKWWKMRLASDKQYAALYYNTVSLHEGSHKVGDKEWWKRDRKWLYKEFLAKLIVDLSKFIKDLEASGRNVVVVFVPEHGMALRGSAIQTAGLRDIPLPDITNVPVGIKFIGPKFNNAPRKQKVVTKPVSYLGLSHVVAKLVEKSPFQTDDYTYNSFIDTIPQTDFMAENEGGSVIKVGKKYYHSGKDKKWVELPINEIQ